MYQKVVLDNGLRLIFVPKPDSQTVAIFTMFHAGADFEGLQESGISHFAEHMMFQGTEKRPTDKSISEAIEGVGGEMNAETDRETVCYFIHLPLKHFELGMDVLSDILFHPLFDPEELEKEKGPIIEEWKMVRDDPAKFLDEFLWPKALYGNQPAGRFVGGSPATIKNMTRAKIIRHLEKRYLADSATITVVGNLNIEEVVQKANQYFSGLKRGRATPKPKLRELPAESKVLIASRGIEQTNLYLGVKAPYHLLSPEFYAFKLLSVILGEGAASRLFQLIRSTYGLAYAIGTEANVLVDKSDLSAYTGIEHSAAEKTISLILNEYRKMKETLVSPEELNHAREFKIGWLMMNLEEPVKLATYLSTGELLMGAVRLPEQVYENYSRVTPEDIRTVARQIFQPSNIRLALVGPFRNEKRFERIIKNL